jgi:hypothetical protein
LHFILRTPAVDQDAVFQLCEPYRDALVEEIREGFGDYDHIIIPEARPTVLAARAKVTSCRLIHRMETRFGRDMRAPIRVQTIGGMDVVVIVGEDFDVALRLKKYDGGYQVYQHPSWQQDDLRRDGQFGTASFPELEFPLAHVMLGYRCTKGLQPRLLDIALSFERQAADESYYVDWYRIIWSPDDGYDPSQTFTPPLFPADAPSYEIKPKQGGGKQRAAADGGAR